MNVHKETVSLHRDISSVLYTREELMPLIEAIQEAYGYDFTNYNLPSLGRRVSLTMGLTKAETLAQFQQQVVADRSLFKTLVERLSINVTAMFRDPMAFRLLRERVLPTLSTYPHIRIWCAGVATGEEAYSMAILLKETNLYHRSLIYATDFNPVVIHKAFKGCFPLGKMAGYTQNYLKAGGKTAFSKYYRTTSSLACMVPELRENIVFSTHNLVTDGVFNEFHLILCRNVLIYFDEPLTQKVIHLFHGSLVMRCFLLLGSKEFLYPRQYGCYFDPVDQSIDLYMKAKSFCA